LGREIAGKYGLTYDGLGRLLADTTVTVNPANCTPASDDGYGCSSWTYQGHQSFSYDDVGNREDNGGDYDTGNRITDFLSCTYTTDDDGNVTSEQCASDTTNYTWDAQNRLTEVTHDGNTYALHYDALGRLGRMDLGGNPYRYFLWDGDDLLAELDSDGDVLLEYSYYPGMDNLHAVEKGGTVYYAHRDIGGNVIALTTGTTLSRTYQYSPWGATTGGSDNASFNGTDRARWKGALSFPELNHSGGLYYMRARWYHPVQGRFLSEDPIGLAGGINPYVFAGDDPIGGRDPSGLDPCFAVPYVVAIDIGWSRIVIEARTRTVCIFGLGGGGGGPIIGGGSWELPTLSGGSPGTDEDGMTEMPDADGPGAAGGLLDFTETCAFQVAARGLLDAGIVVSYVFAGGWILRGAHFALAGRGGWVLLAASGQSGLATTLQRFNSANYGQAYIQIGRSRTVGAVPATRGFNGAVNPFVPWNSFRYKMNGAACNR
jgi:RHS repeat-associated protein